MAKKKRSLTKFEQFGLVAVIAVAVMYLYVNRMYNPAYVKWKNAQSKVADARKQVSALEATPPNTGVFKSLKGAQADWRTATSRLSKAQGCLAAPEEVSLVVADIIASAAQHQLKIRALDPAEPPKGVRAEPRKGQGAADGGAALGHSYRKMVLTGTFDGVRDFLAALGQMRKLVWADNVSISLGNENGELLVTLLLRI